MTKVCIVQKRQIVLLKKEIYVEGSQEEIEEWIIHNQLDDTKYQWRTHTEYIDPGHEEYEILEVPEDDGYDFLRYVRKPRSITWNGTTAERSRPRNNPTANASNPGTRPCLPSPLLLSR